MKRIVTGTLHPGGPQRLLMQTSHACKDAHAKVLHWWINESAGRPSRREP
jgi:hypothetical protein